MTYRVDAAGPRGCHDRLACGLVRASGLRCSTAPRRSPRDAGATRLWLTTTNDNLAAVGFYQRRGLRIVAVHRGAVDRARLLKPSIPVAGDNGIELHDELELELLLAPSDRRLTAAPTAARPVPTASVVVRDR